MNAILVYDINEKRVGKVLKICRKYLTWVQNSVFEGEATEAMLEEIRMGLKEIIDEDEDMVVIYRFRSAEVFKKEVIGIEK
ncbi:MAG: CRISPR-associated endonuclease Cas2, partial [Candidatus Kapaibacteriota bacterium]